MAEVNVIGEVAFGDMHTAFGFQTRAAEAITDYLSTLSASNQQGVGGMVFDHVHECAYPDEVFVPHNQIANFTNVLSKDTALAEGAPGLVWDTLSVDGSKGSATAAIQHHKDGYFGHQYIDVHAAEDVADSAVLSAIAYHVRDADGNVSPLRAQRVRVLYSKTLFTRLGGGGGVGDFAPSLTISVRVGGYWYKSDVSAVQTPTLQRSNNSGDGSDGDFSNIRTDHKGGSAPAQAMGATGGSRQGEKVELVYTIINQRLSVSHGGGETPVLVPHGRSTRTGIVRINGAQVEVAPGTGANLPPTPFDCQIWDGNPDPDTLVAATVSSIDGDVLTVDGGLIGVKPGFTLDILDPRIDAIRIDAKGFTQVGFEAHPAKWLPSADLVSAPLQLGSAPGETTPIFATIHGTANAGEAGSIESPTYTPLFPEGASASIEFAGEGTILQYHLVANNPPNKGSGNQSWQGQYYADEVMALTRVTVRIPGEEEIPANAYTNIFLGVDDSYNPVQAIDEGASFNPIEMTIDSDATITLDNWNGTPNLTDITGVSPQGNVAVAVRLGYEQQRALSDIDGGVGFWRFYGFSGERSMGTEPGGGAASMRVKCVTQMQQLRESMESAPPDEDLHNHYWTMGYLAQRAGIPVRRMAFADLIPDKPYGVSPFDPSPYFLPAGIGNRPWTPVNRTMSTRELMEMVRKTTGFLLFFDAKGMLHYEPWQPLDAWLAGPKRVFRDRAAPGGDGTDFSGGFAEMHSISWGTSVLEVRNQVLLIGIDAMDGWQPTVTKFEDSASITSPPGSQPFNYKGYRSPFVWMDSRFANYGFATRSAYNMFRWMRLPAITVNFTAWTQPDLYPLDVISVIDPRNMQYADLPFYIMSIRNSVSVLGGQRVQTSRIQARYLDPLSLSLLY